jgi:hypothetical protein
MMDPTGGNRQVIAEVITVWRSVERIVFSTENDGHRHDLFIVDDDGTDLT